MSNLYIQFQERLIAYLMVNAESYPDRVRDLANVCRSSAAEFIDWPKLLVSYGFAYDKEPFKPHEYPEYKIWNIILEQIDDSGEKIIIRNLLGMPLVRFRYDTTADPAVWKSDRGNFMLRSETFSQACALNEGDILLTGERVVCMPREGGNGSVLVCIKDESRPVMWLEFPHRTVLALAHCEGENIVTSVLTLNV